MTPLRPLLKQANPFTRLRVIGPAMMLGLVGLCGLSVSAISLIGCKSAKEEAKTFKKCSRTRPCRKPNVCIRVSPGASDGICVYPCSSDGDCPKPFRCTGRYRLITKQGQFCRRPTLKVGGDCSKIQNGCKMGLRCFKNQCIRECKNDDDCSDKQNRCIQIVDDSIFNKGKQVLYKACLKADKKQGESCRPGGPFCERNHVCQNYRCLRICKNDEECGKAQICDGSLYTGKDAKKRAQDNARPDLLYCRKAGAKNAYCNLKFDKSCQRGLYCLSYRCRQIKRVKEGKRCREMRGVFCDQGTVCYAGRCRKICSTETDCSSKRRRKPKCEERTVHKKRVRICL